MMSEIDKATATQIANIEKMTGNSLAYWINVVQTSGLEKHGELVNYLKSQHGFTHGNANVIVHFAKKSHAGAADNQDELIVAQYQGKEELHQWYNRIMLVVATFGTDIEIAPKKAYVSLRRKKQFAIIQPSTKTRLDVGLNIKDTPVSGLCEPAGSWNSMCTHRIKVEHGSQLDDELFSWLRKAYAQG